MGDTLVASADASEVYVFDASGRHLRTLDGLSGLPLHEFEYDEAGRLGAIVDAFGNATRVERDADGALAAIVGPYGATTELELNGDGLLVRAEDPEGHAVQMRYDEGGLLTRLATRVRPRRACSGP